MPRWPPPLPPEIFDLIIDHLHNEPITLKACYLVSKSWLPRSRTHIFAHVEFDPAGSPIESWMKAFPDPLSSPAHYTHSLCIRDPGVVPTGARTWVRSFRHVRELSVRTFGWKEPRGISPVHLNGLSPTLTSLHLTSFGTSISEIIGLICSFPLLEDLSLYSTFETDDDGWTPPPTSPKFAGSLRLRGDNRFTIRRLLALPDGLHFSTIQLVCHVEDVDLGTVMDLVSKCSGTLESLYLRYYPLGASLPVSTFVQSFTMNSVTSKTPLPLDLSNAMQLKDLEFRWGNANVQWITVTLRTVRSRLLQRITLYLHNIRLTPTEDSFREWHELDHLLVQLWTSHSVLPKILYGNILEEFIPRLLPEITRRGFIWHQVARQ